MSEAYRLLNSLLIPTASRPSSWCQKSSRSANYTRRDLEYCQLIGCCVPLLLPIQHPTRQSRTHWTSGSKSFFPPIWDPKLFVTQSLCSAEMEWLISHLQKQFIFVHHFREQYIWLYQHTWWKGRWGSTSCGPFLDFTGSNILATCRNDQGSRAGPLHLSCWTVHRSDFYCPGDR